ncbi:hypothetical protein I79_020041 [Cricetulus griseus]|uniref:Uncharacterized protein n=1 Tax=Cricetulus griseus TaxID=10029 RepID=G3I908_CRIGR|nr:hypothetical protein I79_020041 [Cricetulus griseus]
MCHYYTTTLKNSKGSFYSACPNRSLYHWMDTFPSLSQGDPWGSHLPALMETEIFTSS